MCFFISFFFLNWFVFNKNPRYQNLILLFTSYIFYLWLDWRFLFLLIGVSLFNFYLGIYIEKKTKHKRLFFYIALFQSIGSLVFFKYFDFFITSFNDLFLSFDIHLNLQTLHLLIPIGISFYTFRIISYIIDIYKEKITPTKDPLVFLNYVSFFPSILSGPIDKAKLFIPQLEKKREFDYTKTVDGMRQILWGLFKKVVIADNCSSITNQIFDGSQLHSGSTILVGAFFYTIQIYADFSGYTDMAIGFSRLIGFNISQNFNFPFFSRNIAEFWRKWHISLTTWLTEYVFIPLNLYFRDFGKFGLIAAILINFTLVGIWHGPNWTYILFGFVHGCYFIPSIVRGTINKKNKTIKGNFLSSLIELINILLTFILIMLTYILFRSNSITDAINSFSEIVSPSLFTFPNFTGMGKAFSTLILIGIFMLIEWAGRNEKYAIAQLGLKWKRSLRYTFYYMIIFSIFWFGAKEQQFIYAQF